ncbi:MAG: hypothetical protein V3S16_04020 [Candidatus Desulfatibia sp.]
MRNSLRSAAAGSPVEQDQHVKELVICITLTPPLYPHKNRKLRHFLAFPDSIGGQVATGANNVARFLNVNHFRRFITLLNS